MVRLEHSEILGRTIRQDDPLQLGISTWKLVREAIEADKTDDALALLEYGAEVDKRLLDGMMGFVDNLLTHSIFTNEPSYHTRRAEYAARVQAWSTHPNWIGVREAIQAGKKDEALRLLDEGCAIDQTLLDDLISFVDDLLAKIATRGEDEVYQALRKRYAPRVETFLKQAQGNTETLYREVENQRGHYAGLTVTEDEEKYIETCDPCGTGGHLRRTKNAAVNTEAHPWSWNRTGLPFYCTHCTLMWMIIPIELRGYPTAIILPGETPQDPCVHLYYKKPELIPEEYYTMIGKSKPNLDELKK